MTSGPVNFILPYERLRAVNVTGTREVLKFATRRRLKALHYVSTLSVFPTDPDGPVALEEDLAPAPGHLTSGYPQSKWVAERLVLAARRVGDLLRRYLNYLLSCGFLSLPEAAALHVTTRAS